jgi:excisionase family DNA binding protein
MPLTERDPDGLLTVQQAAELAQVSASTIVNWADKGALPVRRTPGGHRRFRRADVEAVIQ